MKKSLLVLLALAASAFAQRSETATFLAALSPANEVPPIVGVEATGTALVYAHVMRDANNQIVSGSVDFVVMYNFPGEATITGLHIHSGAAGVNGPVTINSGIAAGANSVAVTAPFRDQIVRQGQALPGDMAAVATLRGMFSNPADYYVNLHTAANPGGIIRGQLIRAERSVLIGRMSTAKEIPAIPNNNGTGVGTIEAVRAYGPNGRFAAGVVIFDVDYQLPSAVTFTGLHIHTGGATVNGPVIINTGITAANSVASPANGQGNLFYRVEVPPTNNAQIAALEGIFDTPAEYYVNLHTTVNPSGVIRSQLAPTEEVAFSTTMLTSNEVPPVTGLEATAGGNFYVNLLRDRTGAVTAARATFDINYRFPSAPVTFTGLHIHDGAAGANGPVTLNSTIAAGERAVVSANGFGNIWRTINVSGGQALTSLNSLLRTPDVHYLNLHTTANPGGAVRAQLAAPSTRMPRIVEVISAVSDLNVRTLAQGGQFTIFGDDFSRIASNLGGLEGLQLPTAVNGTSVTIGGIAAPIVAVGFEPANNPAHYIVAQVPFEAPAGEHDVIVRNAAGASAARRVTVAPIAPAMFFDAVGAFAVRVESFEIVRPTNPARAGETLAFVTTGLGQTMPPLATGQIPDSANVVATTASITIGGRPATVLGATTVPGYVGLYIVIANVPTGVTPGQAQVMLRVGTATANVTSIAVR